MKVAICYYGLIRGFKFDHIYESHRQYMYDVLKSYNIDFSVYISTYDKDYNDENIKKIPNIGMINIRSDKLIANEINKYSHRFTCPENFSHELKINLLKSWDSQQDLYTMILNSKEDYDFLIVMDIAQKILNPIDDLRTFHTNIMYVPNFGHQYGYNDRMTIGNKKNILFLLNKLHYLLDQEKIPIMCTRPILRMNNNKPNLHPESFYKIYLDQIGGFKIRYFKMKFWRCRTDGSMIKDI